MTRETVFEKIVYGKEEAHIVYEDENCIGILNKYPVTKGHLLLIPKQHVENIYEAQHMEYLWEPLVKLSRAAKKAYKADGVKIIQNNEPAADQEIMHLHIHIIPRYENKDTYDNFNQTEKQSRKIQEPEKVQSQIKKSLGSVGVEQAIENI